MHDLRVINATAADSAGLASIGKYMFVWLFMKQPLKGNKFTSNFSTFVRTGLPTGAKRVRAVHSPECLFLRKKLCFYNIVLFEQSVGARTRCTALVCTASCSLCWLPFKLLSNKESLWLLGEMLNWRYQFGELKGSRFPFNSNTQVCTNKRS